MDNRRRQPMGVELVRRGTVTESDIEMILSYLYSLDKIWFYNVGSLIGSLFYLLAFFKCVIPNANPNILLISTSFISSINFNNCSLFIALYPLYL